MGCGASRKAAKATVERRYAASPQPRGGEDASPSRGPRSPRTKAPAGGVVVRRLGAQSPVECPVRAAPTTAPAHGALGASLGGILRVVVAADYTRQDVAASFVEDLTKRLATSAQVLGLFRETRVSASFLRRGVQFPPCEIVLFILTPDWLEMSEGTAVLRCLLRLRGLGLGPELLPIVQVSAFTSSEALAKALNSPSGLLLRDASPPGQWGRLDMAKTGGNSAGRWQAGVGSIAVWSLQRIQALIQALPGDCVGFYAPAKAALASAEPSSAAKLQPGSWRKMKPASPSPAAEVMESKERPAAEPEPDEVETLSEADRGGGGPCPSPLSPMRPPYMPRLTGISLSECGESSRPATAADGVNVNRTLGSRSLSEFAAVTARAAAVPVRPVPGSADVRLDAFSESTSLPPSPTSGSIWGSAQWAEAMRNLLGIPSLAVGPLPERGASKGTRAPAAGPVAEGAMPLDPEEARHLAAPVPGGRAPVLPPSPPSPPLSTYEERPGTTPPPRLIMPTMSAWLQSRQTRQGRQAQPFLRSSGPTHWRNWPEGCGRAPGGMSGPPTPRGRPEAWDHFGLASVSRPSASGRTGAAWLKLLVDFSQTDGPSRFEQESGPAFAVPQSLLSLDDTQGSLDRSMWWGSHPAETSEMPAFEEEKAEKGEKVYDFNHIYACEEDSDHDASEAAEEPQAQPQKAEAVPKGKKLPGPPLPEEVSGASEAPLHADNLFKSVWQAPAAAKEIVKGHFGQFELGARLIASRDGGGWGLKFIAVDCQLHRRVVMWRFSPFRLVGDSNQRLRIRDALSVEVELLKKVRHPRLCPYFACDILGGELYVVSGYGAGGSVADWIADAGPLAEAAVRRILKASLEGLCHLHAQRLIHGALRGGNVLLGPGSAVRLCDFALLSIRARMDGLSSAAAAWQAPEVQEGCDPSASSDIWSLGCLVVEMATGSPPGPGAAGRALRAACDSSTPPLLAGELASLPTSCHGVVKACLQLGAASRPSAEEILAWT